MLTSFVISFREGLEIFLVIIPLLLYYNKNKLTDMSNKLIAGGSFGFIISLIVGVTIFSQTSLLEGSASEIFEGIMGIILAVLVLFSVVLLRKNKAFNTSVNKDYISLSKTGIFILAAVTVFREMLETVLFILATSSTSALTIISFVALGLLCSALAVYIASRGLLMLNIGIVFYILNIILICLGAYYFGGGLSELFESSIPQINTVGILVYGVPALILMTKKDLKKLIQKQINK